MSTLTSIDISPWFVGEHPSNTKFNLFINNLISILDLNCTVVDGSHRLLLQDSGGGAEQAKLPFVNVSAPTRWTRNTTILADQMLRVTSGVGGGTGGTWSISAISITAGGSHTHNISSHSHTIDHTHYFNHYHGVNTDSHSCSHSHSVTESGINCSGPTHINSIWTEGGAPNTNMASNSHTHSYNHTHSASEVSAGVSGASSTSTNAPTSTHGYSGSSDAVTGTTGNPYYTEWGSATTHSHVPSYAAGWRPRYVDVIICNKDADPSLDSVTANVPWYTREKPSSSKINSQICRRINSVIDNVNTINTNVDMVLQGASGGTEQATLLLSMISAPTGWTKDTTYNDRFIRVTSGVGCATSGSWSISGVSIASSGAHYHRVTSHTHPITHSHSSGAYHSHTWGHAHVVYNHGHYGYGDYLGSPNHYTSSDSGTVSIRCYGIENYPFVSNHNHQADWHSHHASGSGDFWSSGETSLYNNDGNVTLSSTGALSSDASGTVDSGSSGSHTHTFSHDGTWRPKYKNVLVCKKD